MAASLIASTVIASLVHGCINYPLEQIILCSLMDISSPLVPTLCSAAFQVLFLLCHTDTIKTLRRNFSSLQKDRKNEPSNDSDYNHPPEKTFNVHYSLTKKSLLC